MGCGNSKDDDSGLTSSFNPPTTPPPAGGGGGKAGQGGAEVSPLLSGPVANVSSITAKVLAANNLSLSQTKHIHDLGTVNITENHLMDVITDVNSNPHINPTKTYHSRGVVNAIENPITDELVDVNGNSQMTAHDWRDPTSDVFKSRLAKVLKEIESKKNEPNSWMDSQLDDEGELSGISSSPSGLYTPAGSLTSQQSEVVSGLLPEDVEQMRKMLTQMLYLTDIHTNSKTKTKARSRIFFYTCNGEDENGQEPAEDTKRVPYTRQSTYTKYSEGVVNLGFDPHSKAEEETRQQKGSYSSISSLSRIAEGERRKGEDKKHEVSKNKEVKEEENRRTSTELEPAFQEKPKEEVGDDRGGGGGEGESRGVRGRTVSISSCSSTSDTEEEGGSVVGGGGSLTSHLDLPTSSFHSVSSIATATSERSRKKATPSREMKAALKVLNDSLGKPVRSGQQLTNALNIIQREWFKISSGKDADPHAVEDYMDVFEDYSKALLQRVVNLCDVNGNTAMHYAVSHGNFDVVSILLDSRVCNVNQQNKAGYTAAMLVSLALIRTEVHTGVVQRLFQMADVNIKASQHGQTALMLAVSHGRLDMVRLLVGAGADVNIQDEDGSTALMCAAEHGHLPIVAFLLSLPDTDPTLMDHDGSTALTIAVEAGHKDVGVLLYKHMNLSRGSSPYSSVRIKRSRTPTLLSRSSTTPPPRSSAPTSPGRSRKSSAPASPGPNPRHTSASLSNLIL